MAHAVKSIRRVVSAFMSATFAQKDAPSVRQQWRQVADQWSQSAQARSAPRQHQGRRLAYTTFPAHRAKLHSTKPLKRLDGEIERRTAVVDFFPKEASIVRLLGVILLEQNDAWRVQCSRYLSLETIATPSNNPFLSLPDMPT